MNPKSRRWLKLGIAAVIVIAAGLGFFVHSIQMFASAPVYQTRNGALDGYDPVAYFKQGEPVCGQDAYGYRWLDADWFFASAENRAEFVANPMQYAPQFGGYCAYAVANGYTARTDPDAWRIVDGKLYLNFDEKTRAEWLAQAPQFIRQGEQSWPAVIQD